MAIRIFLGNVGSGKTAALVKEMFNSEIDYYSNIKTQHIKNNHLIKAENIIKKEFVRRKKNGEEIYKLEFNKTYWQSLRKKTRVMNVVIDEAHTIFNSRRATSKRNIIMSDFVALIRKILSGTESGWGDLTFISQLDRRIDIIAQEMATNIRFYVCHYLKTCKKCGFNWQENNETPEKYVYCPACGCYEIKKHTHIVECWHFKDLNHYQLWKLRDMETFHRHYFITDIEQYFPFYDTFQWDNLLSEY